MRFYVVLLSLLSASQGLAQTADVRVLVFSRTAGFRHDSIPDGIAAIRRLADERGFVVEASEDPTVFRDGQLEQYRAVVFLSTTGDILTRPQEEAFERYIRRGGGFVGVHAAADTRCRPLDEYSGCQGRFTTLGGHGSQADDLFYTVEARYTDAGGPGVGSLTARTGLILQPKRKEAEHYTRQNGVLLEDTGDVRGGGQNVGWIDHGDYLVFAPVNLAGIDSLSFRVASASAGGRLEVRMDGETSPLLARLDIPGTGEWQRYIDVGIAVEDPGGTHELFIVAKRNMGDTGLYNINWIDFHGPGVSGASSTAVADADRARPNAFSLAAAYPNPSNGSVMLGYTLPEAALVRLEVFDVLGQRVATVVDESRVAGQHRLRYDTSVLASGLYLYRLSALGRSASRRLVVVK